MIIDKIKELIDGFHAIIDNPNSIIDNSNSIIDNPTFLLSKSSMTFFQATENHSFSYREYSAFHKKPGVLQIAYPVKKKKGVLECLDSI